jgi:hypothetical protein
MTASCNRRGIDPFHYRADVLRRLPTTPPDRLTEPLSDVWSQARPNAAGRRALQLDAAVRRGDNRVAWSRGMGSSNRGLA